MDMSMRFRKKTHMDFNPGFTLISREKLDELHKPPDINFWGKKEIKCN